jgi:hypothetical protein
VLRAMTAPAIYSKSGCNNFGESLQRSRREVKKLRDEVSRGGSPLDPGRVGSYNRKRVVLSETLRSKELLTCSGKIMVFGKNKEVCPAPSGLNGSRLSF